jgi:PAS domain S-box-containing protein
MAFSDSVSSPFWFPDSILLCALLRTRMSWWWLLLLATLPIRLFTDVHADTPGWFLGAVYINDCLKAVLGALLLKRFLADPIRFNSMRDFGVYCLVAVFLVPLLSAFGGAAARLGLGSEFPGSLEQWFLGNAMANLVVTPVLFYWVLRPPNPATFSVPRFFEATVLVLGLMITLALAFEPIAGPRDFAEWRYYAPLPFIVWAAIRFRMFGATGAVALLTVFAVVAAIEGSGSFANLSPEETSSRLQHFLLLRAAPLYLVAVLIEQTWQVGSSLRKSEQRYRDVVESQTDFLCRFRPDTTLTFVNAAYCSFIGKPHAELLGVKLLDLLPVAAREAARDCVARALARSEQAGWECEVAYPDGARGWQHWVCQAIESTQEEGSELQAMGRDITDRKRAEESGRQLAQATRFAAVGELTAMVAHEINQPLCAILSNAEAAELLLQTQQPPLQEIREILADIRKDDLRADAAIRGIRSLLQRREFQPRPVDVNETVNHVLTLIAGDALHRRVQVRRELAADLPKVIGDPSHLEQVLVILIVNGMDAMKKTPEAARELTITARRAAESLVEITIQDRGHGIAPASMPQLFDSFFTTKADGMGLGLSIARSMIAAHGGTIWAENAPEGGAIFRFTLCVDAGGAGP